MNFNMLDLLTGYIQYPPKEVKKNVTSFLRSKYYKDAMRQLKLNPIRYAYAKQSKDKELAYYIMDTKKNPVIIICADAVYRFSRKNKLNKNLKKLLVYDIMLHEMGHAYLDCRGLERQSEVIVDRFALKALQYDVKKAKGILTKYLKKRGR